MTFKAGDVIARGDGDIVERVLCVPWASGNCCWCTNGGRDGWHLEALYLGKRFATQVVTSALDGARLATEADHEQAKRYAERFNNQDRDKREPMKKQESESEVKVERFTRCLRVVLKEGEVVERAKRSAFLLGEIQQKESERDAAKKQANALIEELGAEMHRLSLEVRDGAAYRDVPCTRHYVYRLAIVEERRSDTEELIHERPMTERERQTELDLKEGAAQQIADNGGEVRDTERPPPLPTEKKPRKPRKPKSEMEASQ
jgi:hypothetical protein